MDIERTPDGLAIHRLYSARRAGVAVPVGTPFIRVGAPPLWRPHPAEWKAFCLKRLVHQDEPLPCTFPSPEPRSGNVDMTTRAHVAYLALVEPEFFARQVELLAGADRAYLGDYREQLMTIRATQRCHGRLRDWVNAAEAWRKELASLRREQYEELLERRRRLRPVAEEDMAALMAMQ